MHLAFLLLTDSGGDGGGLWGKDLQISVMFIDSLSLEFTCLVMWIVC
jgi:hypothetical protein